MQRTGTRGSSNSPPSRRSSSIVLFTFDSDWSLHPKWVPLQFSQFELDDALDSTHGYSYSLWRKLPTFGEAEEFLHANGVIVKRLAQRHNGELTWTAYDVMDPDVNAFVAFCDGCALRNGRADCTAAYDALFPHN